jgi:hypothetical protein
MNNTITFSSELMKNYKQAAIMSPEEKFEALQTDNGHALLFSVGTDKTFYVTQEISGHDTGWEKTDLSSALIAKDFAGKDNITCKTFEIAQNAQNGSIGIAMVINDTQNDHLYLCLGNSNTDTSWLDNPAWIAYTYDDAAHPVSTLIIPNVFISETASNDQYIVVDSVRDPDSPEKLVYRHYIDTDKADGYAWHPHDLPFDLEADSNYASSLGRQKGQYIDGMYTFGQVDGASQFAYQPLYNVWNPTIPPSPARLNLPGNIVPEAMAPLRKSDFSTDLFVSANSGLYYFSSANQKDNATATLLYTHEMFHSLRKLFAFNSDGNIIVWGLNADDEIFYTACPVSQITQAAAWSHPLPILTQVDMVSPYVNKVNNGNAFFAVAGNELKVVTQSPHTTSWKSSNVMLPALDTDKAHKFSSYTTRIQLNDENDQPLSNTPVSLSASTRTPVYINHLYYILDNTPILVNTDQLGSITIVEWVDSLTGTQFMISEGNSQTVSINPMETPFNKIAALNTADSLKNATITSYDGSTQPLVDSSVSSTDLQTVASGNQQLADCYDTVSTTAPQLLTVPTAQKRVSKKQFKAANTFYAAVPVTLTSSSDPIEVAAGDLYNWLKSGIESVIQIVKDAASGAWHFIANIAGQVYRAVLNSVETIVGAVEWLFNAIKTAIEDLIAFLEFLFEWADITRTKKVMKNLATLFLHNQVDSLPAVKQQFNDAVNDAITAINNWAGMDDLTGLGSAASEPVNKNSTPSSGSNSSSTYLTHHFQNNAGNISLKGSAGDPDPTQNLIDTLLNTLSQEGQILGEVITQLEALASDITSLSLTQVLERLMAILADGVLESAANVIDALIDLLQQLGNTILSILSTPIHIPVISDILNDFGVPDMSMLDLFCWVCAVPATLIFKLANNSAPFPDDSNTSFLINADDYNDVVEAFAAPENTFSRSTAALASTSTMPASVQNSVFVIGHTFSGFFTLMSSFVTSFEAAEETGDNPWSTPSMILGTLSGASNALASNLVPKMPTKNTAINWLNNVTTGLGYLNMMIFSGPAQDKFASSTSVFSSFKVNDSRATGAIIDASLAIPALIGTVWHYTELSKDPASSERSQAIVEETSNIMSYLGREQYAIAVNAEDPETKGITIGIMIGSFVCYSGLQLGDALIS